MKRNEVEFLRWLANRLVHVYKENPNVDFVLKLNEIVDRLESGDVRISRSSGENWTTGKVRL